MATTKIWDVRAHVSKLLAYVANKNKTTMEFENKSFDESEKLAAEILGLPYDHFATEEKKFVSGINCTPENAKEIMLSLLEDTDSSDIQAYHGYQSFKPNEVTHEYGNQYRVSSRTENKGCLFAIFGGMLQYLVWCFFCVYIGPFLTFKKIKKSIETLKQYEL